MKNKNKKRKRKAKITPLIETFINKSYDEDDELTSVDLTRMIADEFGVHVHNSTVKKCRRKLGWVKSGVRYAHLVRWKNQKKRFAFASQMMFRREDYSDVIFTG